MVHTAMLCSVCDKVGRPTTKNALPKGWRRVTVSNPDSMKKRGNTGIVCQPECAERFVADNWKTTKAVVAA